MSLAQRCAGVLKRKAANQANPVNAGILTRSAELIERQEHELAELRKVYEAAWNLYMARCDQKFARACGGVRKLESEVTWAARHAETVLTEETACRDLAN